MSLMRILQDILFMAQTYTEIDTNEITLAATLITKLKNVCNLSTYVNFAVVIQALPWLDLDKPLRLRFVTVLVSRIKECMIYWK